VGRNWRAVGELAFVFVNPELLNCSNGSLDPGTLVITAIPNLIVPLVLKAWIQRYGGVVSGRFIGLVVVLLAFLPSNFCSRSKPVIVVEFVMLILSIRATLPQGVFSELFKLSPSKVDFVHKPVQRLKMIRKSPLSAFVHYCGLVECLKLVMEVSEFVPLPWAEALVQDVSVALWRLILIAEELDTFFDIKSASN
jgi:energy-coupling factor transporter transmembrane protein EcfT